MGKPQQLNKQQVDELKKHNAGSPIATEKIEVKPNTAFSKELDIRENDVYLLNMIKR
jgi:xylan 1,4-beta-xylosidase